MSIPSNVAWATRSMSGMGGGILSCLEAGRYKIISFVLSVLIVSLFLAEHAQILSYSRKKHYHCFKMVGPPVHAIAIRRYYRTYCVRLRRSCVRRSVHQSRLQHDTYILRRLPASRS